ncbi:MAG: 16S rRNA processing protein RimM [Dehalococcoidia bacterium]|nr:16S rRNA processing protein RimM [Chloroflexota bacterium]MCK4242489.1 16S rRNA processing protein RimM [Dehalococcoidia bacterium]
MKVKKGETIPQDPQFIVVGRVVAPWGIKGEVKVEAMTDFPDRFSPGEEVHIDGCPLSIERSRWHKGRVILKLATVDSLEAAESLRGRWLEIPQSKLRPLPQDQYYQFQLTGLEVWTTEGKLLGRIVDILPTGSNDVYVVRGEHGELLIPAIEDVVKSVELETGRVVVELIPGLLQSQA